MKNHTSTPNLLAKAAIVGLAFGALAEYLRIGAQIAVLGKHDVYNGEVTILGLPVGHLMYDGQTGFSLTQNALSVFSVPVLCAIVAISSALARKHFSQSKTS